LKYIQLKVAGSVVYRYDASKAYDNGTNTILPDSTGMNNATGEFVLEKYIPALDDGTDDVEGLGLTNPPGTVHNNCESKIKQDATNTEFLDNTFWSADGVNYDAKSWADFIAHANFDNNVVLKWDSNCWLSDALTWAQDYSWTPSAYQKVSGWVGTPCYEASLEYGDL